MFLEIEAKAVAAFKFGKVAVNIPTAFRNMVSNFIQINMSGRPFYKIPGDVVAAAKAMLAKDTYYKEASDMGLFHTNWFATEINDVLDEFRKAEGGGLNKVYIAIKKLGRYYGRIDDISKFTLFLQQRKKGKSVDEAAVHALKWGMNYSLASKSVKAVRRHLIPFATYNYKIAPLIAESLRDRPWVLAKYAILLPLALEMFAKSNNDLDDEDMKDLEKQLPTYIKNSGSVMLLELIKKAKEIEKTLAGMTYKKAIEVLQYVELTLNYQAQNVILAPVIPDDESLKLDNRPGISVRLTT